MANGHTRNERILRLPEVRSRTGLSRSSVYEKMKANTFPRQRKLGSWIVGWYETEIDEWIANPR